jgi:hypothetical protein
MIPNQSIFRKKKEELDEKENGHDIWAALKVAPLERLMQTKFDFNKKSNF